MEFERHQTLHTIIMLKDVVRKWWRSELSFADKTGVVIDWQKGEIIPPPNDFCRLSLFSKEGLRRCCSSVKVLHEKFKASKKLRRCQFHDCHLGFSIVGAPLYINNEYEGMFFVEGFLRQSFTAAEAEMNKRDETIQTLSSELSEKYKSENIIGKSGPMLEIFRLLEKVCNSDSTVLVNGESGTGKELVARAIHYNGPRKDKPFVVQN